MIKQDQVHEPCAHILVVDDDCLIKDSLCDFLALEGYTVDGVQSQNAALRRLNSEAYSLAFVDVNLPDGDGLHLLNIITRRFPDIVPIIITGYASIESAVKAVKQGAFEYLAKPISDTELRQITQQALRHSLHRKTQSTLYERFDDKYSFSHIISHDSKMLRLFELVHDIADTDANILMTGPSGTGKSMLARAIHYSSGRRKDPFIEVSCGTLTDTLLESELFGHVKGAFTGAVSDKQGKFLAAHKGTILLDEIGNASGPLQLKLLRILEDRQFEPVGSNKTHTVDTRIILATNCNLIQEVREGRFREDLYYRINVVNIELPPLRDRKGDIPLLAHHFLDIYSQRHRREKTGISEKALSVLQTYAWPGNIRELENVIERAVLLSHNPKIISTDLPDFIQSDEPTTGKSRHIISLKEAKIEPEKQLIRDALKANHWNRTRTARALKINRTTLYKKMKRYGLERDAK